MDYQRATQAYIWSTPLVSVTAWRNNKAGFIEIEPRVWMFTDYYSMSPGSGLANAWQRRRL